MVWLRVALTCSSLCFAFRTGPQPTIQVTALPIIIFNHNCCIAGTRSHRSQAGEGQLSAFGAFMVCCLITAQGLMLILKNGDACVGAGGHPIPRTVHVIMPCTGDDPPQVLRVDDSGADSCQFTITLPSRYSCPLPQPPPPPIVFQVTPTHTPRCDRLLMHSVQNYRATVEYSVPVHNESFW